MSLNFPSQHIQTPLLFIRRARKCRHFSLFDQSAADHQNVHNSLYVFPIIKNQQEQPHGLAIQANATKLWSRARGSGKCDTSYNLHKTRTAHSHILSVQNLTIPVLVIETWVKLAWSALRSTDFPTRRNCSFTQPTPPNSAQRTKNQTFPPDRAHNKQEAE